MVLPDAAVPDERYGADILGGEFAMLHSSLLAMAPIYTGPGQWSAVS